MNTRAVFVWHFFDGTDRHPCTIMKRGDKTAKVTFDQPMRMPGGAWYKAGEPVTVSIYGLRPTQ